MYSLTPGYRIPALQRGLSPAETMLTKANAGLGSAVLMSALISPPPLWAFGTVGVTAALMNLAPGPRSIARWATVGYRHLRERTAPEAVFNRPGATATWALYPNHGVMQDELQRGAWHEAFSRALTFAGNQTRTAGVQVHVSHHATVTDHTTHTQTISVHVPKGLTGQPARLLDTLAGEFARLGALTPLDPAPIAEVSERRAGWVALKDGRYASTARITAWPDETAGDLMPRLLLGEQTNRSLAVLYRPLPAGQSRRSAKLQTAAAGAYTLDEVKAETHSRASTTTRAALIQGATLVDLDAYLTVWADSPQAITDARYQAVLTADRYRIRLDWLPGQQHRAHVMTTPHGAATQKGAIL
ncbi:hypothetical protein RFN57_03545 [Streptomyces violaceochromogenes]|uniref:PrgI family protein n=1 Tax=Streptomyces violaceochromogenes TaxID=67377 RepID=A0ABU6LPI3_9ACTN|nr:hypothetical protein [Streptomyces violaceochromogenes]MEC7051380.1 hypothetical protein [Streptomyces violaceochromogenes]GHC94188.1 hypothetical protein GCM10010309_79280 [Streptomyces violaceochromogenes]